MELFNIIYLIIPVVFYMLSSIILTKFSRTKWSLSISFYRQLTIFIVWLPLLYFFPIDFSIFKENLLNILLTSSIWAVYLLLLFKSYNYIPVAIGSAFSLTSRILLTILIWIILVWDSLNLYQSLSVITLIIWILLLLKIKDRFKLSWILLPIIWGWVFVINWYFFLKYSPNFHPIIAGYILEVFNGLFLLLILIWKSFWKNNPLSQTFHIEKKPFWIIFATAPLVIMASWAVAKSYELFSFTIVWIALTMMIPVSLILSWIILKEKLSLKSIISIIIITLSIVGVKFFEG